MREAVKEPAEREYLETEEEVSMNNENKKVPRQQAGKLAGRRDDYPDWEKVRVEDRDEYIKMFYFLQRFSKREKKFIHYFEMQNWYWPVEFGPAPEGWDEMPNYRKPGMTDDVRTRADYLNPISLWL